MRYFILICLLFPIFAHAVILENKEQLKGCTLGYYIGSFDPIHLGHQHVVEKALEHVDYVLIYPVPGGDDFKNRSDWAVRKKMVASIYERHPRVLYTAWTPKELQDNLSGLEVLGIIGSDVVTESLLGPDVALSEKYRSVFMKGISLKEKHYEDTIGALMALKASSFLVNLRGDVDLSHIKTIDETPIRAFIQSTEISSTEVRKAIQNQKPFEHFLSFPVQALIKEKGLYGYPSSLNFTLQNELLEMCKRDQSARMEIINKKISSDLLKSIDAENGKRLKAVRGGESCSLPC